MIDLSAFMNQAALGDGRFYGVTVGIVTNNKDEEGKLARVKVRFPWLSDQDESYWARIAMPMAGNERGAFFLPEVNDEVLVAFEHGLVEYPIILGALWNGKDKPPETNQNGENNLRFIKSRSGHILRFDDTKDAEKVEILTSKGHEIVLDDKSDAAQVRVKTTAGHTLTMDDKSGSEKITLVDKSGSNKITITSSDNSIKIESNGPMTFASKGDMKLDSKGKVQVTGATGVEIVSNASGKFQTGAMLDIKAGANANVQASGIMNVKGAMVNIN